MLTCSGSILHHRDDGGVRRYGSDERAIPFPLECMRPIVAEVRGWWRRDDETTTAEYEVGGLRSCDFSKSLTGVQQPVWHYR
jgi:hypothetical protein